MSDKNDMTKQQDKRVPCKYGASCYQKNEAHKKKYLHPPPNTINKISTKVVEKNTDNNLDTSSPKATTKGNQGTSKRNSLDNWLKLPPNKKQKSEDGDQPIDSATNTSSDADKTEKSATDGSHEVDESKTHKPDTHNNEKETQQTNNSGSSSISLLPIKMDAKTKIKSYFLVDMPPDFYQFWTFCESIGSLLLSKGNPLDAFKSVGLRLVGPFEVLAGKFSENTVYDQSALLRHYRFYYDPPEFQTVILRTDDSSEYHMGYFRDDPKENPVFVASNCSAKDGIIKSMAENLFGAVNVYLEEYKKKADPFAKLKIVKLQNSLTTWAKKENITLSTSTSAMKKRESKAVTKTFHKAGLVVPFDKKTDLGYRQLAESDATIKKILTDLVNSETEEERKSQFSKLFPIITYANIANDECDFGTGLELGLDLFTFGSPLLHDTIKRLMTTSYQLLNRDEFATIIEAHLEQRTKRTALSILTKK